MPNTINATIFQNHVQRLFTAWKKTPQYKSLDFIEVTSGNKSDKDPLSSIVLQWLTGYDFLGTTFLFCKHSSHIYVLSNRKKLDLLDKLKNSRFNMKFIERRADNEKSGYQKLIKIIKESNGDLGTLVNERGHKEGNYTVGWYESIENSSLKTVNVEDLLNTVIACKDDDEISNVRSSAQFCSRLLGNYLRNDLIETAIETDDLLSHRKLSNKVLKAYDSIQMVKNVPQHILPEELEPALKPVIQSGGKFDFSDDVEPNDDTLHFGTIVTMVGSRYRNYCAMLGRTYMINPTKKQTKVYKHLLELRKVALENLKPATMCSQVYNMVVEKLDQLNPKLLEHFLPDVGFGIGIQTRNGFIRLAPDCKTRIQPGMSFVIRLGFTNLDNPESKEEKNKTYSLMVADTVVVHHNKVSILTKSDVKNVTYELEQDEEEENDEMDDIDLSNIIEGPRRKPKADMMTEEMRNRMQRAIRQKNYERFLKHGSDRREIVKLHEYKFDQDLSKGRLYSYPKVSTLERMRLAPERIFVDKTARSIILPINDTHVPFHVSTIRALEVHGSVNKSVILQVQFRNPSHKSDKYMPSTDFPLATYVKEVSFVSRNKKWFSDIKSSFDKMRRDATRYERDFNQKKNMVRHDPVVVSRESMVSRLRDISVRPALKGKKSVGTLEAHGNGLKFQSGRGERIEILYDNIEHSFFQPAERDRYVLIHFHLKDPILVGKKTESDIQFYTEVIEEYDQVSGKNRLRVTDMESRRKEEWERAIKDRLNAEFDKFVKQVAAKSGNLHFEQPVRDYEFTGGVRNETVRLAPTATCLVHLRETPLFVLPIDDIEVACFQRVSYSNKNFDIIFVRKDYKTIEEVSAVQRESFELIKDWMNNSNISYFKISQSYKWDNLLKAVREDEDFVAWDDERGWNAYLGIEEAEEEEEDDEEMVDEYVPEEEEYEEEEEEEEDEDFLVDEAEAHAEEIEEMEDIEDGKNWEELEREAVSADKRSRHGDYQDEVMEDHRPRKRSRR